jgi:hypothetical protein
MDSKKIANNILEFLFDPTVIPVKDRLYFRKEEILKNESFDSAKADALKAYGGQKKNSDFYPSKNRQQTQREASIMDRKTLIASMDVLSQQFDESDPIGKDLRTMAYAVSKMSDEELVARTVEAKKKMEMIKCPTCGGKVMKQTGYCLHCKKKIKDMKEKDATEVSSDFWSKEAADAVKKALLSDVCGMDEPEEKKEPEEEAPAPAPEEKEEEAPAPAPKKEKAPPPPAPKEEEEEVDAGKKCKEEEEEASTKDASKKCKEEEASKEKDAGKKKEELEDEKDAGKKKEELEDEKDAGKKKEELEDEKDASKKEDAKKKVDTGILSYEGIELGEAVKGLVSADEIGELTADEKSKLDQLFQ